MIHVVYRVSKRDLPAPLTNNHSLALEAEGQGEKETMCVSNEANHCLAECPIGYRALKRGFQPLLQKRYPLPQRERAG